MVEAETAFLAVAETLTNRTQEQTMRLAIQFDPILTSSNLTSIAANIGLLEENMIFPVSANFIKEKTGWKFSNFGIDISNRNTHPDFVLEVASQVLKELAKHEPTTMTPRELVKRTGKNGGRQVAYDGALKKHVMVKTLEGRESVWWATLDGKHLHDDAHVSDADGVKQAQTFLRVRVANLMGDNPELAEKLSKWFVKGCSVEQDTGSGASNYVNLDVVDPLPEIANPIPAAKVEKKK